MAVVICPERNHPERGRRRTRTGPAKRRMRYPQHFMLRKVNNDTGEVLDLREWYGIYESPLIQQGPRKGRQSALSFWKTFALLR